MRYEAVNWFAMGLDAYYDHDNNGFIYGVYAYENEESAFPVDVSWFRTEETRDLALKEAQNNE